MSDFAVSIFRTFFFQRSDLFTYRLKITNFLFFVHPFQDPMKYDLLT